MQGPGKYDDVCTKVREEADAEGAIVVILNGKLGSGFSVQVSVDVQMRLPTILRQMAQQIEEDNLSLIKEASSELH